MRIIGLLRSRKDRLKAKTPSKMTGMMIKAEFSF